jgi:archaeosine synthase
VLLLSPCSYKKPYASSRTHQKLDSVIEASGLADAVHKVVVTSPVGLVPEEIDCLPPASSYDIPVIGVWDANEREMIAEELEAYLKRHRYELVINHVSTEMPALKQLANVTTVDDHPLSGPSQESLLRALKTAGVEGRDRREGRRGRFLSRMESLAEVQFGTTIGFDNARRQRLPSGFRSILAIGGKEAATWSEGPLAVLGAGAAALAAKVRHLVTVEDIKLTGDVFAPGVLDATSDFRRGDEVAVVARTPAGPEVRAAGVALMSGMDMKEQRRGRAVAVRRRFPKPG